MAIWQNVNLNINALTIETAVIFKWPEITPEIGYFLANSGLLSISILFDVNTGCRNFFDDLSVCKIWKLFFIIFWQRYFTYGLTLLLSIHDKK